jgi:hypothetical protein
MYVNVWRSIAIASVALLWARPALASGQGVDEVDLIVKPGRPLRVALDERVTIKRVGQPITATVKTKKPGVSDRARDGVERAKEAAQQAKRDAEQKVRDALAAIKGPHISRPVGVAFAAAGVARTVYSSVFARGRDVSFPADTPIQVQLPPGPKPEPR